MKHDAADELYIERTHAQGPPGRLANGGKSLRQQLVQRLSAFLMAAAELLRLGSQFMIAQFLKRRLKRFHAVRNFLQGLQLGLRPKTEYRLQLIKHHGSPLA